MRQSRLFAPTLREIPAEAEVVSHQLMLRAGFIRQLAAGIYAYLPLGWRVLRKVERIIREEMDRTGAQELLMPAMQPTELWKESGRYEAYGPELMRLLDRHDREFALGPTHEEVITALVRNEISSYRKLPVILYQIQTKFRDERRPRSGLLRSREFLMKDAYSFDTDWSGLDQSYWRMVEAYRRIFERCELKFRAVEADAGTIGGEGSTHEFMALSDIGEDTVATCTHCGYAANLEKAVSGGPQTFNGEASPEVPPMELFHTPALHTIDQLVQHLHVPSDQIIKTLLFVADGSAIAVLVRGDHEVNDRKVGSYLGAEHIQLADAETVQQVTGAPVGFAGPVGLTVPILVDNAIANMKAGIAGANKQDYHIRHVQPGRDFPLEHRGGFRNACEGDLCPQCGQGSLQFSRGIEVGHVFKLGMRYSKKLGASFLDAAGREQTMIMGCYGIGVSRILSAIVEQNHDEQGMIWPKEIAPFHVHLIPVSIKDSSQMKLAEELYEQLQSRGVEVLIDDRDERPGIKFKDSDLIGIPYRIVIGKQSEQGIVEWKPRGSSESHQVTVEEAISRIHRLL